MHSNHKNMSRKNNQLNTTIVQTPDAMYLLCDAIWWMKTKLSSSGEGRWSYQGTTAKRCTLSRMQTKMFTLLQVNVLLNTKNKIPSLNYSAAIYNDIIVQCPFQLVLELHIFTTIVVISILTINASYLSERISTLVHLVHTMLQRFIHWCYTWIL